MNSPPPPRRKQPILAIIVFGGVSASVGATACALLAEGIGAKVAAGIFGGLIAGGFVGVLVWLIARAAQPIHKAWGEQIVEAVDAEPRAGGTPQRKAGRSQLSLAVMFQLTFTLAIVGAAGFYMVRAVQNSNTGTIFGDKDDAFTAIMFVLAAPTLILAAMAIAWRILSRR